MRNNPPVLSKGDHDRGIITGDLVVGVKYNNGMLGLEVEVEMPSASPSSEGKRLQRITLAHLPLRSGSSTGFRVGPRTNGIWF